MDFNPGQLLVLQIKSRNYIKISIVLQIIKLSDIMGPKDKFTDIEFLQVS